MLPVEALMQEHRIIERLIPPFRKEAIRLESFRKIDKKFIEKAVDFLRIYGDRNHHGKEEGILFRELGKKPTSTQEAMIMKALMQEHAIGRRLTGKLEEANARDANGDSEAWRDVNKYLNELAALYSEHIEKEDKRFFYPINSYFSANEQEAMLKEFENFNRKLVHEIYAQIAGELEKTAVSE